jgi:peptidoglycan/xylan/chitin deacetylase (PgdA/CDA1 family)
VNIPKGTSFAVGYQPFRHHVMAAFGIGMAVHYGIEIRLHSMRKKLTLAGTAVVSVVGLLICWPRVIVRVLRVLFPNVIWELHTSEQVVAITFDDGPDPNFTPKVLEVMRKYNIQATFFLVGERARRFPQLVEQIRKEGHFVANHSDSWRRTIQLDGNEFERDLLRAEHSIGSFNLPKLFRPAGGRIRADQIQLLWKHKYSVVLGSAYAFDPYRPPKQIIQWAITRGLKPGAIIVLHDSGGDRSNTVEALPTIIENAQRAGLRFAQLSKYIQPRR